MLSESSEPFTVLGIDRPLISGLGPAAQDSDVPERVGVKSDVLIQAPENVWRGGAAPSNKITSSVKKRTTSRFHSTRFLGSKGSGDKRSQDGEFTDTFCSRDQT